MTRQQDPRASAEALVAQAYERAARLWREEQDTGAMRADEFGAYRNVEALWATVDGHETRIGRLEDDVRRVMPLAPAPGEKKSDSGFIMLRVKPRQFWIAFWGLLIATVFSLSGADVPTILGYVKSLVP